MNRMYAAEEWKNETQYSSLIYLLFSVGNPKLSTYARQYVLARDGYEHHDVRTVQHDDVLLVSIPSLPSVVRTNKVVWFGVPLALPAVIHSFIFLMMIMIDVQ